MTVRMAVRSALSLLNRRDRRLLSLSIVIQMGTALLDLVGVLLIGLVGALAVTTVQSQPPPEIARQVAGVVGLSDLSEQGLVVVFAGAAAAVLLAKSVLSSYLTRRVFIFLANRQALVSARLAKELLSRPLTFVLERSTQETAFALINGTANATLVILGQLVILTTEIALLVVLGAALLWVSPGVALSAIAFFGLVAAILQKTMGSWSSRIGTIQARAEISSLNAVQEALGAYREITVSDRRAHYVHRIQELRWQAARVAADAQFVGMLPKYMFEAALVVGGFALAGVLFATQDSVAATGTLALFLAAGSRVMPSILRLQAAALGLRVAAGAAQPTFELAGALGNPLEVPGVPPPTEDIRRAARSQHAGFQPSVSIEGVSFRYPGASRDALRDVDLHVAPGTLVALVGRSGAGKSTLADIILGVLQPLSGTVLVGGTSPVESVQEWTGAISYVPQDVSVANGSIRENVALGLPEEAIDDALVMEAIERAHLSDLLVESNKGLDTYVGERGVRLSGGQRQRLGIARALYTRPKLLVLDEATSALDAETELSVAATISELGPDVTVVVVAHRLSTVRNADLMVYLEDGRISAIGTFEELAASEPSFRRQAALMGLLAEPPLQD